MPEALCVCLREKGWEQNEVRVAAVLPVSVGHGVMHFTT